MTEKKHYTIPFFIPELACPFQCVFCDQKKISGRLNIPDIQQVISTIESHLATIPVQDSIIEAGFFGGNFTGIPFEQQRDYLQAVQPYIQQGLISAIRVSTRPDYITPENLGFLKTMHVQTIELGAQSLNDEVLK
ncbi:MAG: radical SAM protein, partial [Methanococcaceae archaeon]